MFHCCVGLLEERSVATRGALLLSLDVVFPSLVLVTFTHVTTSTTFGLDTIIRKKKSSNDDYYPWYRSVGPTNRWLPGTLEPINNLHFPFFP